MNSNPRDYDALTQALEAAGVEMSAAEAHGVLSGAGCAPSPAPLARLFFGAANIPPGRESAELVETLTELMADVQRRLAGDDFDFEPLLDTASPVPVDSLADWARGFVFGLTASGVRDAITQPGEVSEFVQDVLHIGELESDPDDDAEEQGRNFAEIVEYLRVGVQVVYEELHAPG